MISWVPYSTNLDGSSCKTRSASGLPRCIKTADGNKSDESVNRLRRSEPGEDHYSIMLCIREFIAPVGVFVSNNYFLHRLYSPDSSIDEIMDPQLRLMAAKPIT